MTTNDQHQMPEQHRNREGNCRRNAKPGTLQALHAARSDSPGSRDTEIYR